MIDDDLRAAYEAMGAQRDEARAQRDRAEAALRKIAEHPLDDADAMRWLAHVALDELGEP